MLKQFSNRTQKVVNMTKVFFDSGQRRQRSQIRDRQGRHASDLTVSAFSDQTPVELNARQITESTNQESIYPHHYLI